MNENLSRRSLRHCLSERGVEAVELAIVLPVFLGLFFGFIDLARIVSGYSSVRTAAALGARYAVARDRRTWTAVGALVPLGTEPQTFDLNGAALLNTKPEFVDGGNASWYQEQAARQGLDDHFYLYRAELKAIAYANRIMKQSVGAARYPCSEAGCFGCFTLRGNEEEYAKYFSMDTGGGTRTWGATMLGVQCIYHVPITTALLALKWLPEDLVLAGNAYVPFENYAGLEYDPSHY